MNAGPHGAGRSALLTLARPGIAAGAPGSAAWAAAATTTAPHSEGLTGAGSTILSELGLVTTTAVLRALATGVPTTLCYRRRDLTIISRLPG